MDIMRAKDMLKQTAQNMYDLADRMSKNGAPLANWERDLIRTAFIPAVKEQLDLALLDYLVGREIRVDLSPYTID